MNKNFLLLFCFITSFAFSQEYHYDYFIAEHSVRFKPDNQQWTSESFYDSVNQKMLFIRTQNDKIIASIYDKENNRSHIFKVNKLKDKITFIYKHTNQYPQQQHKKDYNKENIIKVEKLDSLKYNVTVFKNSKLKKKKISAIVTLEKSEFNYINFNADYNRTDEINKKIRSFLNPKFNYIISNQQKKYHSSDYTFEESIQKIQKTDLTIIVPEKLVLKEYNYWSDFED
ncbi:MAG: hypothetical protein K0R77_757 [Chryseobacterium sp.]|jgi:hypothetical protein|uniref:hypothetical protein n=1 Tax=Chryseobacterium sp. TaxID=1871047 RepID=UPI002615F1D5|nr:hypothetical protein [Chryseobacterium sp.]MDF2551482.1 hypothetical protein [Chryseobacterium sp.]